MRRKPRKSSASPAAPCRLFALLAHSANVGVLLRRGPTRWVRMIRWDVSNDKFELGQWLNGKIYEDRCDLSPDGKLLAYIAAKPHKFL